jgi:maleylpyruvate isomerase
VDTAQRRLSDQIDDATQRLLSTARVIPESGLRAPSMLPGWTRAHVLAHLARSADAMRSLLIGARDGQDRPAYASAEARAADIEQGASQQPADLAADVASAAMALRTFAARLPDPAWQVQVQVPGSAPFPAGQLLVRRLVEVELHHCDLGLSYRPADWPSTFTELELTEPMRSQRQDRLTWAQP